MEWREEKILVKGIFEEKRSLDGIILLFRNIDQKKLLDSQVALIERHKNLALLDEIVVISYFSTRGRENL